MPITPTYIPLGTITLSSTDSEIVFSSIPAGYRDLIVVFSGTSTSAGISTKLNVNGDTSSSYSYVRMVGSSSGATSNSGTIAYAYIGDNNTLVRTSIVQIMDYSATDKHKTMLVRYAGHNDNVQAIANRWANTAAITQINIAPVSGSWASGAVFSLYGIA